MWAAGTRSLVANKTISRIRALSSAPRLLVVDGYAKDGREALEKAGMQTAGVLYQKMFATLEGASMDSTIIYPADSDFEFPDLANYDAVGWTGSSLTIYHDTDPNVTKQIELCKRAVQTGLPQFGSCWGLQLAASLFGAKVERNPKGREFGIGRKVHLTPAGLSHPMFAGRPSPVFDVFSSHDDEVVLGSLAAAPALSLLASNSFSKVQALTATYKDSAFWSVQYHPEYDLHELARLTHARIPKLIKNGNFVDEAAALAYIDDLESLHANPAQPPLRWKLGIDEDILDPAQRRNEVRNWVKHVVHPYRKAKVPQVAFTQQTQQSSSATTTPTPTPSASATATTTAAAPNACSFKPNAQTNNSTNNTTATFAMSFDVDGVLMKGGQPIKEATHVLRGLQERNIPFVLVTNGGGHLESDKARDLSAKLGVTLATEQIILAHTPMKKVTPSFAEANVLVVGKRYEKLKQILHAYGCNHVFSTEDFHNADPLSYPDLQVTAGTHVTVPDIRSIDAVFCLIDPLYWGRDIQIVCDALRACPSPMPIFNSCADLEYSTDHKYARLGAGAFGRALNHVVAQVHPRTYRMLLYGKPHAPTYEYAQDVLVGMAQQNNQHIEAIYMVGDNLDTDIKGANQFGGLWRSILTQTGLYNATERPQHNATRLVNHVGDAFDFALARHS